MINPFQLMQNPMGAMQNQMMEKMRSMNPQMYDSVLQMTSGKTDTQLREMAENVARERGIDIKQFASQMGLKL